MQIKNADCRKMQKKFRGHRHGYAVPPRNIRGDGARSKNGVNSLFLVQHSPIYTSIIGLNCPRSIVKMHFFDFAKEKFAYVKKKQYFCSRKSVKL